MAKQATTASEPGRAPGVVLASNRGPLSLVQDGAGGATPGPEPGGAVKALATTLGGRGASWFSAPMTDLDRTAARSLRVFRRGHLDVHFVNVDPEAYREYHGVVADGVLWPLFHGLLEDVRQTMREVAWVRSWQVYREVNIEFAMAIATYAPVRAAVVVHDHHLLLVGYYLRLLRPDLRVVHFSHTPFCAPQELRELPLSESLDLLEGLAAYRAAGFRSETWESAFRLCCDDMRMTVPRTFVLPVEGHRGDPAMLTETPASVLAGGADAWLAGLLAEASAPCETSLATGTGGIHVR